MPNQFTASLWGDEGFSAILSMKSIPEIIEIISRDTSPPLYNITEHIAFKLFGSSEVVIRGLSFFYYLLAIFFIYKTVEFIWNKKTALLASVVTFLNPFFFIYAFEGRMYSIMALGVAASMYFFLRILLSKKPQTKMVVGHIIATAWAIYSHHFAIFIVMLQGLIFLVVLGKLLLTKRFKPNQKKSLQKKISCLFLGFLGAGVLYIPWLIPLYNQTKMVGGGFWLGTPTFLDLLGLIHEYLAKGIDHALGSSALILVFIILALRDWGKRKKVSLIFLLWFLFPITATWAISQFFQSVFYNRYLLYAIPGATILLATSRRKFISLLFIIPLIITFAQIDYDYFTNPTKRPFKTLAEYVKENKRGDDILINWNAGSHHLWETKYYGIPAPIYIPNKGELPFFVGTALMEEGDIIREIPTTLPGKVQVQRVGVVTSGNPEDVVIPGFIKSETHTFGNLKLIWNEKTY